VFEPMRLLTERQAAPTMGPRQLACRNTAATNSLSLADPDLVAFQLECLMAQRAERRQRGSPEGTATA
jgi:hypothetical protein